MNTALVIVDMLRDFVDGRLANPAAMPTIERIHAMAEAARRRKDWIVAYGNDAHTSAMGSCACSVSTPWWAPPGPQVVEELTPQAGHRVPKRYYSAFTQTDLAATCLVQDVGRVVIVGQPDRLLCAIPPTTPFLRGFEVVVPADATAVFQPLWEEPVVACQQRALDYLRTFYGVSVVRTADLLGEADQAPSHLSGPSWNYMGVSSA